MKLGSNDISYGAGNWQHKPLKHRVQEELSTTEDSGSVLGVLRKTLKAATVVETSEALDYFIRRTPEEEAFTIRVFPNLTPASTRPLFFEGRAPAAATGGTRAFVIKSATERAGQDAMKDISPTRMGYLVRAGVFGEGDEPPWWPAGAQLMVELAPFIERADGEIDKPPLMWQLPLDAQGAVVPVDSGDALPMMLTDPGLVDASPTELQSMVDTLSDVYRGVLFCGLFILSAMNAYRDGESLCDLQKTGKWWTRDKGYKLSIAGLEEHLEQRAKATEIGLGHALTVCRENFRW